MARSTHRGQGLKSQARQRARVNSRLAADIARVLGPSSPVTRAVHDSIIRPPLRPRTMPQRRMSARNATKNLIRPFRTSGRARRLGKETSL